jgi:hypothetical protein
MTDLSLSFAQRNHLRVALKSFEEALRLAEAWLEKREETGFLYTRRLQLPDAQREQAARQIEAALAEIHALAAQLGYAPREEDAGRMILAELSVAWTTLIDAESSRLKSFGRVEPQVAEVIDPAFEHLAQLAMELAELFKT